MSWSSHPPLDVEKIASILDEGSRLSVKLKPFESRREQTSLLKKITEAFNSNAIALLEAGTGTGKSLAYLIPSLLAAAIWHEKVVISTHTISLQEQLFHKDLPILMDALGLDLKVVIAKGMGNYVCLRKFDEIEFERRLLQQEDQEALHVIEGLCKDKRVGSRSDFPSQPAPNLWEMINSEHDTCNGSECGHFSECYYINARKNVQDAHIIIVNHHLLLADLSLRAETDNFSQTAILPPFQRLVLDEAHHIEEIATDYFASRLSRFDLLKTLSKINTEKNGKATGKIPLIKEKVQKLIQGEFSRTITNFLNQLTIDLPALKRDLLKELAEFFQHLDSFQHLQGIAIDGEENKWRLKEQHYTSPFWQETIQSSSLRLSDRLKRYALEIRRTESLMTDLDNEKLMEASKSILFDLKALSLRLEEFAENLHPFTHLLPTVDNIRWIESSYVKGGINLTCVEAALNISQVLFKYLFTPFKSVVLLSATLANSGSFRYIKERMGLTPFNLSERPLIEATFESPFDYQKQALFVVPKDLPEPSAPHFLEKAQTVMIDAILASKGNAFILFTSYSMLQACYKNIAAILTDHGFHVLKQGDDHRHALIERYKNKDRSVLFGTSSFWEGVDVMGDALRLVILVKIPFIVPSDPLVEAKSESLVAKKRDPFYELSLPQAAIKLKQGFGRLIRHKWDRGCVVCLDTRLTTKRYGNYFLKSLPQCPQMMIESKDCKKILEDFYKKTYYLTKKHGL